MTKKVVFYDNQKDKNKVRTWFYRKEEAPKFDYAVFDWMDSKFFKEKVQVSEDGTPLGYHTQEEVQQLKDRIKELEDKYEPNEKFFVRGGYPNLDNIIEKHMGDFYPHEIKIGEKPKNKRGRPKKK